VRVISERPEYAQFDTQFEEMLKPLYSYIQEPMSICFEDEIIMNVKQFIRRNNKVSAVQWEVFKYFPGVLAKNKDSFSTMFDTINHFLTFGKQALCAEMNHMIKVLAQMAEQALFST